MDQLSQLLHGYNITNIPILHLPLSVNHLCAAKTSAQWDANGRANFDILQSLCSCQKLKDGDVPSYSLDRDNIEELTKGIIALLSPTTYEALKNDEMTFEQEDGK
jgi:hypothetical protein